MVKKLIDTGLLCCCIAAAFYGCVNDVPVTPLMELKLGDSTITNVITVPIGGGRFYFNTLDTLNSVRIIFPPNSYSTTKNITLTAEKINGSTFGDNIKPISWLITIDAGNDFSNKDIIIDIPITLDTNNFSMAFLYDPITHELEGVPTVGYLVKAKPQQFSVALLRSGSLFISTISKTKLGTSASSSFDPKLDNWEFPNFGTLITPNGQFAGQSLSTLWYYYEQQLKGSAHLYGLFDVDHGGESPKIWQDNDLGFRVAAEIQQGLKWNTTSFNMMSPLDNGNIALTFGQVLYSMLVTGKPQLIIVIKDSIVLPLIVYKVLNNQFYVSDPNYPVGGNQTINAVSNQASDYHTAASMNEHQGIGASKYINATYIGVRAMIDWDAITKIWTDAQKNVFATFPPYNINFTDVLGNLAPSANGLMTLFDTVTLNIAGTKPSDIRIYQNNMFSIYTTSNTLLVKPGSNHISIYTLNPSPDGSTSLWSGFSSFNIQKQTFAITPSLDSTFVENDVVLHTLTAQKPAESLRYEWDMGDGSHVIKNINIDSINYRYEKTGTFIVTLSIYNVNSNMLVGKETSTVVVSLNPVSILSMGVQGITNASYPFYGLINVPKDITLRYKWSMGDGTLPKIIIANDTNIYRFQNAGTFTIVLDVFDNITNTHLGSTQTNITISAQQMPTLAQIHSFRFVAISFSADNVFSSPCWISTSTNFSYKGGSSSDTAHERIIWNGLKFSASFSVSQQSSYDHGPGNTGNYSSGNSGTISGELSNDGSILLKISFSQANYNSSNYTTTMGFGADNFSSGDGLTINHIPISKTVPNESIIYSSVSSSLKDHLENINWGLHVDSKSPGGLTHGCSQNYIITNWSNPKIIPTITVMFSN